MVMLFFYKLPIQLKTENRFGKNSYLFLGLFKMTNAPITPGIHPQSVNKKMMKNEPHPLSMTDKGGKRIANKTRKKLISIV